MLKNSPKFFQTKKIWQGKSWVFWEYCICWNVILKINYHLFHRHVSKLPKSPTAAHPGNDILRFSFPADMVPAKYLSRESWLLTTFGARDLCFSTTFSSTLLVGFFFACVFFVLWVSRFFFVAGVKLSAWPSNVSAGNTRCSGQA